MVLLLPLLKIYKSVIVVIVYTYELKSTLDEFVFTRITYTPAGCIRGGRGKQHLACYFATQRICVFV